MYRAADVRRGIKSSFQKSLVGQSPGGAGLGAVVFQLVTTNVLGFRVAEGEATNGGLLLNNVRHGL